MEIVRQNEETDITIEAFSFDPDQIISVLRVESLPNAPSQHLTVLEKGYVYVTDHPDLQHLQRKISVTLADGHDPSSEPTVHHILAFTAEDSDGNTLCRSTMHLVANEAPLGYDQVKQTWENAPVVSRLVATDPNGTPIYLALESEPTFESPI